MVLQQSQLFTKLCTTPNLCNNPRPPQHTHTKKNNINMNSVTGDHYVIFFRSAGKKNLCTSQKEALKSL